MKNSPFRLAVNSYAFHWSFPEIVADQMGLFKKWGLRLEWTDATPRKLAKKGSMYTDLLNKGLTDLYHAGEWACIERVLSHAGAGIVAKSSPSNGTLNSTFTLYVGEGSEIRSPEQLANKLVAVEPGTGSFYTALQDLERHMTRDEIKLVHGGEPHRRLMMLARRQVVAASLLGPWADLAEVLGMRAVLRTKRTNPTTAVIRRNQSPEPVSRFFEAVNEAIEMINSGPERVRNIYFESFSRVLAKLPLDIREAGLRMKRKLSASRWEKWQPYMKGDFEKTYAWMLERRLARPKATYRDVLIPNLDLIFPHAH